MNRTRARGRFGWLLIGAITAFTTAASWVQAQTFPSRPIEFVAQSSPGGGTDLFSRSITDMLTRQKAFSQPFLNANRVGGNGVVAYNYIKGKRGDPHVVMAIATGAVLTSASRPELDLPLTTFTPLAMFAQDPQAVAVRTESKFTTMKELIEGAKREPTGMTAGITGPTGAGRLTLFLLERETGVKFRFVTFKGGGDAVLATLGGHVEVTTENMSEMLPLIESKKMPVLAVTGERRFAQAPDVPTLKELGYNIIAATGRGFSMPAAVPKEAAAAMEAALKRVYDSPAYKEYSERNLFENNYLNSAEFAAWLVARRPQHEEFLRAIAVIK